MTKKFEALFANEMADIGSSAREEIVDAQNFVAPLDQPFTEMRSREIRRHQSPIYALQEQTRFTSFIDA